MFNSVLSLPMNTRGRDITVGDIHGEFSLLKKALKKIGFDKSVDRIISTGDLVDKGKNSEASLDWIQSDYFYPVYGNHDAQYAFIDNNHLFDDNIICHPVGEWFLHYSKKELKELSRIFLEFFYPAIQVQTEKGLVGFTHGSTPPGVHWNDVVNRLNAKDYNLLRYCMWNREIPKEFLRHLENGRNISLDRQKELSVEGLSYIFHGHCPLREIEYKHYSIGNRFYIDTGAYKEKRKKYRFAGIVLFDVSDPSTPIYTPY